jgi:hypothetical protein
MWPLIDQEANRNFDDGPSILRNVLMSDYTR